MDISRYQENAAHCSNESTSFYRFTSTPEESGALARVWVWWGIQRPSKRFGAHGGCRKWYYDPRSNMPSIESNSEQQELKTGVLCSCICFIRFMLVGACCRFSRSEFSIRTSAAVLCWSSGAVPTARGTHMSLMLSLQPL